MRRVFPSVTMMLVFSLHAAALCDEVKPEKELEAQKTVKPVEVMSLEQANLLAPDTKSVYVHYKFQLQADQFSSIMMTLAHNPRVRHLRLRLPNSSHVKDEILNVLREFHSLESFELLDCRDFEAPRIFEQVAAMKNLKRVRFSFLCRNPSEAACKSALPKMKLLETAAFDDGREWRTADWETALTKSASDLISKRKSEQND